MQKIVFATDSACDIPKAFLADNNIAVLPYHISFGDEDFIDGVTINRDLLYKKAEETGMLPKTAAIAPAVFSEFFEELLQKGESVIYFSVGSRFSSACQNATIAAAELENVYVVDTASLSSGEALMLLHAIELSERGMDAATIAKDCADFAAACDVSFVLDKLDYMHKGGRCSGTAALGANLLGIKPCLGISNGMLAMEKKYRGKPKVVISKYIAERIAENTPVSSYVFLTNSGVDADVLEAARTALEESHAFETIYEVDAGCVISSHCGPGTLGIIFVKK